MRISDYDTDDHVAGSSGDADNDDNNRPKDRDNDTDNRSASYYDGDDNVVRHYGRAARSSVRDEITALVKRYYAAAASRDGAAACSMILASLARSLPESLGRPPGPPYLRGDTCAAVMSKIFKENGRQLTADAEQLQVSDVRVQSGHAVAVLRFTTLPGRQLRLISEGTTWKLERLLDSELS